MATVTLGRDLSLIGNDTDLSLFRHSAISIAFISFLVDLSSEINNGNDQECLFQLTTLEGVVPCVGSHVIVLVLGKAQSPQNAAATSRSIYNGVYDTV
jgi:hypothetical protein